MAARNAPKGGVDFVAVDVETANSDRSSICSIAVVEYGNGLPKSEWTTLVDPEVEFSVQHVDLHGIDEVAVRGAPTWAHVSEKLHGLFFDRVVVSHTLFDRTALLKAPMGGQVGLPTCTWLDSAAVARSAWPRLANHGLRSVCESLAYPLRHHDALDDAKAAGHVLWAAMSALGFDSVRLLDALAVARNHRTLAATASRRREGVPDAPLAGERVVFAGELSLGSAVTADLAVAAGCSVAAEVNGRTTMLVEGRPGRPTGHRKTRKHRRAGELGADVRSEVEFMDLLGLMR